MCVRLLSFLSNRNVMKPLPKENSTDVIEQRLYKRSLLCIHKVHFCR